MKNISILIVLGFALSLCNLSSKLKPSASSNEPRPASGKSGSETVERAVPTAAQEATLAGGQEVKWDQQGMSWRLPPKWVQATNESKMFVWHSPGSGNAANLIVNISTMDQNFPTDVSINAFYENAKTRAKNGEVDEVKWLEIDGLKGVEFRESNPEQPDGIRRLQWLAYRTYAGQVQMVNLMLSTRGKDFAGHQDAMYAVMYSTKLVH